MRLVFLIAFIFFGFNSSAQDSSKLRFSVLTCSPGDELYSVFGHTALRLVDSTSGIDVVFNYGTFNFDEPGFIFKFLKGSLPYYVSIEDFTSFKATYEWEKRGITEQVLNISAAQEKAIKDFLKENTKEENKFYQYDFSEDNCTTRIREIINNKADSSHAFSQTPIKPVEATYRDGLHQYLNLPGNEWNKLGVDILIGAVADKKMDAAKCIYLPDDLMAAIEKNKSLFDKKKTLLPYQINSRPAFTYLPTIVFSLLLVIIAGLGISKKQTIQKGLNLFYSLFFFLLAVLGCLALFMWYGSFYTLCKNNWNVLWMLPIHFYTSVAVFKQRPKYFAGLTIWYLLFIVFSFFIGQQFNLAVYPLSVLALFISWKKWKQHG